MSVLFFRTPGFGRGCPNGLLHAVFGISSAAQGAGINGWKKKSQRAAMANISSSGLRGRRRLEMEVPGVSLWAPISREFLNSEDRLLILEERKLCFASLAHDLIGRHSSPGLFAWNQPASIG